MPETVTPHMSPADGEKGTGERQHNRELIGLLIWVGLLPFVIWQHDAGVVLAAPLAAGAWLLYRWTQT